MALYSKREFADLCGLPTKDLAVYIRRGNVLVGKNDKIDSGLDKNSAFLQKRLAQGKTTAPVKPQPARIPVPALASGDEDEEDEEGIVSLAVSERRYKHHLALRTQRGAELDQIKIDKARGAVIPSDLMPPLILQHNQSIITAMKEFMDEMIRMIGKKKGLSAQEIADLRASAVNHLNEAMDKATDLSIRSIDNIINDFSEKRGVGERV